MRAVRITSVWNMLGWDVLGDTEESRSIEKGIQGYLSLIVSRYLLEKEPKASIENQRVMEEERRGEERIGEICCACCSLLFSIRMKHARQRAASTLCRVACIESSVWTG